MQYYQEASNIDLRQELHDLLYGRADLVGQGRYFIYRRLSDTKCSCWKENSGGPRRGCSYCQDEGYLWSETKIFMYLAQGVAPVYKPGFLANGQYPQTEYGYSDPNRATGFAEYNAFPDYERYSFDRKQGNDKLYDIKVTDFGGIYYPITKTSKWKILNVTPYHGDNGRIEYFELSLEKETIG